MLLPAHFADLKPSFLAVEAPAPKKRKSKAKGVSKKKKHVDMEEI
jgi:hypothetical protein